MDKLVILIVDSDPKVRDELRQTIAPDFRVLGADSYDTALKILEQEDVAIVLTEHQLRDFSGLALLQATRRLFKQTINILYGQSPNSEVLLEALNSNLVWRFLEKPFDPRSLFETLQQAEQVWQQNYAAEAETQKLHEQIQEKDQQLVLARTRFRTLFEESLDTLLLVDPYSGLVSQANKNVKRLFGYTPGQIIGEPFFRLLSEDSEAEVRTLLSQTHIHDAVFSEFDFTDANGKALACDLMAVLLDWCGKKTILLNIRQATERKAARQEIKRVNQLLRQKEEELRTAKEAAEEANRAKSAFLATMSHDIRTPLNGIIGYAELLQEEQLANDQLEFVKTIYNSAEFLLQLINEILDLSKIESGTIELESQPFKLYEVIEEKLRVVRPYLSEKQVELNLQVSEVVPKEFIGDSTRIGQIVMNLLSNAAKFTDAGSITVEVSENRREGNGANLFPLQILVRDTGKGIPAEKQKTVFDSFTQIEPKQDKYKGTGLGLAITKKLVELMNGSIRVDSEVDKGTTFTVLLPLQVAHTGASERCQKSKQPVRSSLDEPNKIEIKNYKIREIDEPAHILLVEDDQVNWQLLKRILERLNHRVSVVESGKEALEILREREFDLVLMDIQMPEMDGYETTRRIRANPALKDLPVIAITANAMVGDAKKCLQAGCDDYITKPIKKKEFIECINAYLNLARLNQTNQDEFDAATVDIEREMEKLKGGYITNLKEHHNRITQAIQTEDFGEIGNIGHSLKGSGSSYGFEEVSRLGLEFEKAARHGNPSELQDLNQRFLQFLEKHS